MGGKKLRAEVRIRLAECKVLLGYPRGGMRPALGTWAVESDACPTSKGGGQGVAPVSRGECPEGAR